jgi:PKD domain
VNFTASLTDNAGDTHTPVWIFDGSPQSGTVDELAHTVTTTHTFTTVGYHSVSVTVTDDCGQNGATSSTALIYAPVPANGNGSFVIGDLNSASGTQVTFFGDQWAKLNSLSGGAAPSSFKGFANSTSTKPPNCGGTWTSDPGNSSGPPSSLPQYHRGYRFEFDNQIRIDHLR